jgi:peptidoglycan/xylan/chitin deacetylase (PgdA/CDA1 family)
MTFTRRSLALGGLAGALVLAAPAVRARPAPRPRGPFWPGNARLAVSVTMMFEVDGEQLQATQPGPPGTPQANQRFPNLPFVSTRRYGAYEGVPRLLDLFDKHRIKVSSFMIGSSIDRFPALAREIVERGHEGGGRGRTHTPQFHLPREEERAFLAEGFATLERVTGRKPAGFNAQGLQGSVNTNSLLQELGLIYTIDGRSRDEPYIIPVNGRDFVVSPYMGHVNDIDFFANQRQSLAAYEAMLREEFLALYAEGARRRRMMSVPLHDYLAGRPAVSRSVDRFLTWARRQPGVWFARRDEIARHALESPLTPRSPAFE